MHGGDDAVDVFVGLRGFFINQRFIGADDQTAEGGAAQAVGGVFVRQTAFAFAALPFAAGAVGERAQGGFPTGGGGDEIAVVAARAGNQHQALIGGGGAFAVQPARFAVKRGGFKEVVVHVE